ncbi:hypothetical protein [Streptomyces sp. NPDC020965]|uniref:hypothetical protein n=1 Tax=Streptomyces sp. NPDC020965 TaxID=3365105 RepID=UPI0037AA2072
MSPADGVAFWALISTAVALAAGAVVAIHRAHPDPRLACMPPLDRPGVGYRCRCYGRPVRVLVLTDTDADAGTGGTEAARARGRHRRGRRPGAREAR